MGPVYESAQIVPLVHAAHAHPIAQTDRYSLRKVDVVSDQQGPAVADIDDEALMARAVIVVTQKAADEARDFDPPPVVASGEADTG